MKTKFMTDFGKTIVNCEILLYATCHNMMPKKVSVDFRTALANKEFAKAWATANDFWWGSGRMRSLVIYEMLTVIMEKQK